MLCVLAYLRWHAPQQRRTRLWFALCLGLFAMSLMGKVIGVTLPLVMLVLDWHPLRRFDAAGGLLTRRAWPIWLETVMIEPGRPAAISPRATACARK